MSDERYYDEHEIAEILERATTSDSISGSAPAAGGLTLSELQDIGAEVGIAPARIADAADALAHREVSAPPKTFLGAPSAVARTVKID
ncbi:MAG: hypothetical protein O2992_04585 [Gemmatimonadetes bacterium]|nr:hypothetical protein [Gemmatimonadota bacterium]